MIQEYEDWDPVRDGVTLVWRDVSVYAKDRNGGGFFHPSNTRYKKIINNVTGAVRPGSLVAIMGASGSGKSTLMGALAYRISDDALIKGDIRVNGRSLGGYMQHLSGFMHQDDLFVSSLTVREHLTFTAKLRLDSRTSSTERQLQINKLLAQMGLSALADTLIGSTGQDKVLSGGERKRLSFAAELLTNPPLLFCDEPTTGLDSYSAHTLVEKMKVMADQGCTVLCTIHQPSSDIFNMFHQLILIADGRIAFIGEISEALTFFSKHGYNCPEAYNPADFFIHTLAVTPGSEEASQVAISRLCDEFASTEEARETDRKIHLQYSSNHTHQYGGKSCDFRLSPLAWKSINDIMQDFTAYFGKTTRLENGGNFMRSNYEAPQWTTKFIWLTYRSTLQVLRDPAVQYVRIIQKIVIGLIIGLCYIDSISVTQSGIQAVQGALTLFVTENTFAPMYSVLAMIPMELPLFLREYRSGLYGTQLYYLSKIVALLPGLVVEPLLFIMVSYWLVGLRNTLYAFCMTALILTFTMNVSTACGCFFGCAFESASIAMAYLVPFDYVLMVTSGLFIKLSTLPSYISWVQYLSWLMYSNEALSIVQWNGIHNISCEFHNSNVDVPDIPCITEGWEVLNEYSFSSENFNRNLFAMGVLYCTFHFLGFLCLNSRARNT